MNSTLVTRNSAFIKYLWNSLNLSKKRCKNWNRSVPSWALLPFYSSLLIVRRTGKKWRDSGSNKNELRCSLPKFWWKWIYCASSSSLHTIFRRDCTRGCCIALQQFCMAWLRDCWRWRFLYIMLLEYNFVAQAIISRSNFVVLESERMLQVCSKCLEIRGDASFHIKKELDSCDWSETDKTGKKHKSMACVRIVCRWCMGGVHAGCVAQVWDGQVVCCSFTHAMWKCKTCMVPFLFAESSQAPFSVRHQKWLSPLIDCHLLGNSCGRRMLQSSTHPALKNPQGIVQRATQRKAPPHEGWKHRRLVDVEGKDLWKWTLWRLFQKDLPYKKNVEKDFKLARLLLLVRLRLPSLRSLVFYCSKHVWRLSGTTTMFPPTSAPIHHPSPWRVRLMSQDVFDAFLQQKDTENHLAANVMVPTQDKLQSAPSLAHQGSSVEWVEFQVFSIFIDSIISMIFSICFEAHLFVPIVDGHMLACQNLASQFFQPFSA